MKFRIVPRNNLFYVEVKTSKGWEVITEPRSGRNLAFTTRSAAETALEAASEDYEITIYES